MDFNYEHFKSMTLEEIINALSSSLYEEKKEEFNNEELNKIIYGKKPIDYTKLIRMIPTFTEEDIEKLLRYDLDYRLSFLLIMAEIADSDAITKQAIYLLRRHGLEYIRPLLPYCDEDDVREEYIRLRNKDGKV